MVMKQRPHLLAFLIGAALAFALCWPLPLGFGSHWNPSAYLASHAWVANHLFDSLSSGSNPHQVYELGYPWIREARFIGWVPAIASWPLRPLFGPLGAYQLICLLSFPFSAWMATRWIESQSKCSPWMAAPAGLIFAFCPYQLATLQTGEVPKLQIWVIPLFLLGLSAVKKLRSRSTAVLVGICIIGSFTSPYYGASFPLFAGLAALIYAKRKEMGRAMAVLIATAAGMLPALLYFGDHPEGGASLFRPAKATLSPDTLLPVPHPVASLRDLTLGMPSHSSSPWDTVHESSLGLVMILACAFFFWRSRAEKREGRLLGLGVGLIGLFLAMGPTLVLVDHKTPIPLPVSFLELANYPLKTGGMYYRMAPIALLGMALILATSLPQKRRGFALMWLIVGLQTAEAIRHTGPWPLQVEPVPSQGFFRSIAGEDGAVFTVPVLTTRAPGGAQKTVLRGLIHGRPVTALPSDVNSTEMRQMQKLLDKSLKQPDPSKALRDEGFRYVIYHPEFNTLSHRAERDRLLRILGEPTRQPRFLLWDLGPTTLRPRPFAIRSE